MTRIISETEDFRVYQAEPNHQPDGTVNGYYRMCEEFVGGKWEGFVSLVSASQYEREQRELKAAESGSPD